MLGDQPATTGRTARFAVRSGATERSADLPMICIVGCERSGTTWVRTLFESHPAAVVGRESHAFPTLDGVAAAVERGEGTWRQVLAIRDDEAAGARPAGIHHWVGPERLGALVEAADVDPRPPSEVGADLAAAILRDFGACRRGPATRAVVEKTPGHVFHAEQILRSMPEARIVEVLRDGRDVCVSMQHRSVTQAWVPQTRGEQVDRWVDAVLAGRAAASRPAAAGRWLTVRYEALKHDPVTEVRRLFSFAGLLAGDQQVDQAVAGSDFSRYRVVGDGQHRRRGEVGDWRTDFTSADLALFEERAGPLARSLGYG